MKWISVEDKLPQYISDVLCVTKSGSIYMDWCSISKKWEKREEKTVTHWMPLPSLPKIKPNPLLKPIDERSS